MLPELDTSRGGGREEMRVMQQKGWRLHLGGEQRLGGIGGPGWETGREKA